MAFLYTARSGARHTGISGGKDTHLSRPPVPAGQKIGRPPTRRTATRTPAQIPDTNPVAPGYGHEPHGRSDGRPGHPGIGAPVRAQKKRDEPFSRSSRSFVGPGPDGCYIMPPMPPAGIAGTAGCSDFFSASTHSVVRNIEAIDAAFSSATRDTFVGSMIPAASMSS